MKKLRLRSILGVASGPWRARHGFQRQGGWANAPAITQHADADLGRAGLALATVAAGNLSFLEAVVPMASNEASFMPSLVQSSL